MPCLQIIALMLLCHSLLQRASTNLRKDEVHDEDEYDSDGERVGAPSDATKAWRKLQGRRAKSAKNWICHQSTPSTLVLWLGIASRVSVLHYHLFKHGTLHDGNEPDGRTAYSTLQNLCNAEHDPVMASLAMLTSALIAPHGCPMFGLLLLLVGDIDVWSHELKRNAFQPILCTAGHLWRRLFAYFQSFPWKASLIVDDRVPRQRRRAVLQERIRLASCCGDDEFTLRLREMVVGLSDEEL